MKIFNNEIMLNNKSVLVTGGSGAFGCRFIETVLREFPYVKRIVVFSRGEYRQQLMKERFPEAKYPQLRFFLGDVRDADRLRMACEGIDVLVHAAALNQVENAEYNPDECVRTNIEGSQNVIKAALFGCFDAKNEFNIEQDMRKEAGKQPLPGTSAMFSVNGTAVPANSVFFRHEAPNVFKGLAKSFTCFITRQAVEVAALRFTGHRITKHVAPKDDELLGETLLNDKGYFVSIEGLGDAPTDAELKKVEPQGDGFLLTGDVVDVFVDGIDHKKPSTFRLVLTPGEAPGTWKRQYVEK